MIIYRHGAWITGRQHLPLTAGIYQIRNGVEYLIEVNPLFAVKTGQKLADSLSLLTFKLYFHRRNSLCY